MPVFITFAKTLLLSPGLVIVYLKITYLPYSYIDFTIYKLKLLILPLILFFLYIPYLSRYMTIGPFTQVRYFPSLIPKI